MLEESIFQASRSLSEQRNKYLANLISTSKDVDTDRYGIKKKSLYICLELTDTDIEILFSFARRTDHHLKRNYHVRSATIGAYRNMTADEKQEYMTKKVAWDTHISTLERLYLISPERKKIRMVIRLIHILMMKLVCQE